jgi:hypothetical protein
LIPASRPTREREPTADPDRVSLLVEDMDVDTLATEIQTNMQHCDGPPLVRSSDYRRLLAEEARFIDSVRR